MTDDEGIQGVQKTVSNPFQYSAEARSVQEYRLDFGQEFKTLRLMLTGIRYNGHEKENVFDGLICEKHFSELIPLLFSGNNKGWILSRLHEAKVEAYVIDSMFYVDLHLISKCYFCPDCGFKGEYSSKSMISMAIEQFFYGNMNRSVAGFEAELLAKMQQISSKEDYMRQEKKGGGLLNIFKRR